MKKLIVFIPLLLCSLGIWAQQTTVYTNFTIQKANPTLYLNGTAAVLDFYNGDVTFTQSSNLLTLAGGNLSLGSNSLLMTGSLGVTGGRILKGWMTDLEITNLPTINGGTLAAALPFSSYVLKTDTAAMLTKYARLLSPTFTGVPKISTDTVATRAYARSYGGVGVVTEDDVQEEIADSLNVLRPLVVHVADSAAMLTPYIARGDTASMLINYINKADTAGMLTNYINKADTASMLTNYINKADTASMLTPYIARSDTASMLTKYITTIETATSYAPKASPTFTGTVVTAAIRIGGTSLSIDSVGLVDNRIAFYDGADTLGVHIIAADILDLDDYAVMLADSTTGAGHYASDHRADDIEAALADTTALDTEELSDLAPLWGDSGLSITFPAADTTVTAVRGKMVFQTADSTLYVCRSILAAKKWYPLN